MNLKKIYSGKLAFITGASEGIGKAIASEMVRWGADVVITSRNPNKLERSLNDLEQARINPTQKIVSRAFNLTRFDETEKNLKSLVSQVGAPHYLINCAGYARPGYIENLDMEHYRGMMELNYFGTVHACKTMVPFFIQKKEGVIVNISSMAGFIGLFGYTGYCAGKYAVIGFSEALRRELKIYGIRVSVLCPPNTRTRGLDEENKYKPAEVLKTEEKIRVQEPEEVAKIFLRKLPRNPFIITTTFDGTIAYYVSRFFPWLVDLFVKRPDERLS